MAARDLVNAQQCAPDGTVSSARNPLGALVDGVLRARPAPDAMGPQHPAAAHGLPPELAQMQAAMASGARGMPGAWQAAAGPMQDHPQDVEHEYARNLAMAQAFAESRAKDAQAQEAAWAASAAPMDAAWQQSAPPMDAAWQQAAQAQAHAEAQRAERNNPDPVAMRHTAAGLVDTMAGNAKFANSQFLQFMRNIADGNAHLRENQVAMGPGMAPAPGGMEQAWGASAGPMDAAWQQAAAREHHQRHMEAAWAQQQHSMSAAWQAAGVPPHEQMQQAWAAAAPAAEAEAAAAEAAAAAQAEAQQKATFEEAWAEAGEVQLDHAEDAMQQALADAWEESASEEQMAAIWESLVKAQGGDAAGESGYEDAWRASQQPQQPDLSYDFAENNPFTEHAAPFDEGVRLFDAGQLNDAILAFEAELQRNPDHSEAWRMLGASQAENDADRPAIVCLERAVEADPCNLAALAALGVSYVNELNYERALTNLRNWLGAHPRFAGLQVEADAYSDGSLMDDVMQLMQKAAEVDPGDADVQVVLGVLYNVTRDYDSAIAAFRAATAARPDDYSLWNKLGATLANGSRPAEALPAYDRALELKPRYARGWLNRGISFANLGQYEQSARCYLQALALSPGASHIWSYLRIAFSCLERFDLVNKAQHRDVGLFAEEFPLSV